MATRTFLGSVDDSYADANNWQGTTKPGAGDDVVISEDCTLDEDISATVFGALTVDATFFYEIVNYTVDYGGNVDNNGTLTFGATGYFKCGGNWSTGASLNMPVTATIECYGSGQINDSTGGRTYGNFKCAAAGETTNIFSFFGEIYGTLTLGTGTLASGDGGWFNLRKSGTPLVNAGANITADTAFRYDLETDGSQNIVGGDYGAASVYVGPGAVNSNQDFTLTGHITGCAAFIYKNEKFGDPGCTLYLNGFNITSAGDVTLGTAGTRRSTISLGSATIDVGADLYMQATSAITINLQTATIQVPGDIITNSNVTLVDTASTITLDGTAAQDIDLDGETVGSLDVENTTALVTFSGSFGAAKLAVSPGATLAFSNADTFNLGELDLPGTSINAITVTSDSAGNAFALNVDGPVDVTYADIKDCDADGGVQIVDHLGTDSGGNTNVLIKTDGKVQVNLLLEGSDFDPEKLEYVKDTSWARMQLKHLLVYSDDFVNLDDWEIVDLGAGSVSVASGVVEIHGSNTQYETGIKYDNPAAVARAEGYMEFKWQWDGSEDHDSLAAINDAASFTTSANGAMMAEHFSATIMAARSQDNFIAGRFVPTQGEWYTVQLWPIDKNDWRSGKIIVYHETEWPDGLLLCEGIHTGQQGANFYFHFHQAKATTIPMTIKEWRWYSGYPTDDPVISLAILDSGHDDSEWDMSTFDLPGGDAGLTFSYDAVNDPASPSWSSYLSKANMQLESDPQGRYMLLRIKVSSDGDTQRAATIPRMLMEPPAGGAGGGLLMANKRGNMQ